MPRNPPHDALRNTINRAIASGAPVYTNRPAGSTLIGVLEKAETILAIDRERAAKEARQDTIGQSVLALVRATIADAKGGR